MRVCIHRGASQIGGSCVEIEAVGARIVLDLGLPLDANLADDIELPDIPGLVGGDPSLLGVVISHGHPDHWGLAERINPSVPIYVGQATTRILREARFFTPIGADFAPAAFLCHQEPIEIGPFILTPHRVDHSATDAYAIEVQASGKRLLYSGDLRGHGRRQALLTDLTQEVGRPVEVLLLEGTHIRNNSDVHIAKTLTEQDVEDRCTELFADTEGLALVAYSPQNVDRMITIYRAARASGRKLVLDLYAASIASAIDDPDVPRWDAKDVLIYVPQAQRIKVKRSGQFERVNRVRSRRIFNNELASRAGELALTFRASMTHELQRADCLHGANAIWSMWGGYLDRASGPGLRNWLSKQNIPLELVHASGHASVNDLQLFAHAIGAKEVVPIHTTAPQRYPALFDNVRSHEDGQWWDV